jgi:uncharacterized protein (UPF0264 family)
MKVLVSARNLEEAVAAARAGAHFIDLKEPLQGALGGLPVASLLALVPALRGEVPGVKISATIGDWPAHDLPAICAQVQAVAACGVDYVKVGVWPGPAAPALLAQLGAWQRAGIPLIPVLLADQGVTDALVTQALQQDFVAVMLDTQGKLAGSLLDLVAETRLARWVQQALAAGVWMGLSGALRLQHLPALLRLAPDFAGFRSAVCQGPREGVLDGSLVAELVAKVTEFSAVTA